MMDRMQAEDVVTKALIDNPSWLDGEDLRSLIEAADTLRIECSRMVDENAAVREQISQLMDRVRKYEETPIPTELDTPPIQIQPDDVVQEFGKG